MKSKIISLLRNKYVYAALAFIVWLTFFDSNSLIVQYRLTNSLNKLKTEKQYYLKEIEKNRIEIKELMTNEETLEKFAREKYLMKKKDEEIFVIVEE
jgi:cell division protein FtsB